MPSTSRHHWGTDLDLNNLNNSYFTSGKGKKIYKGSEKNKRLFFPTELSVKKPPKRRLFILMFQYYTLVSIFYSTIL